MIKSQKLLKENKLEVVVSRDHPYLEGIHKSEYKWPQLKFGPLFPTVFSFDK